MILVASPSKPLFINQIKHTAVRSVVVADYEREIEEAYEQFERAAQPRFPPPVNWQLSSTLAFIREVVGASLEAEKNDDVDLFNLGCDRYNSS